MTADHTVGDELRRAGVDAARVPGATTRLAALTCYLGDRDAWRRFSVRAIDLRTGDHLVLSSDGVHRHLRPTDWVDGASTVSAQQESEHLVATAARRGSRDDATAVVLRIGRARG